MRKRRHFTGISSYFTDGKTESQLLVDPEPIPRLLTPATLTPSLPLTSVPGPPTTLKCALREYDNGHGLQSTEMQIWPNLRGWR